jgi:hypothetical protein
MNDLITAKPDTLDPSARATPAGPRLSAAAAALVMATRGVEAALDQVGPRLTPELRAALRPVLRAYAAPAAMAAWLQEKMQMPPEQFQPHPIDTKKMESNVKPRNQQNQGRAKKRTCLIRAHMSPRWQTVRDALPDQAARNAFRPLIKLCHELGVEPDAVDQSVVALLVDALRRNGHPEPESRANAAIKRWTALIFSGLALPPLTPIDNQNSRYRAAWRALPRPLRLAIVQYLRAFTTKKRATRRAYQVKLRAAVALLTAAGRTPQSLDDLIAREAIDFLAAHPSFGDLDAVSHNRKNMLRTLADLARYHQRREAKTYILGKLKFVLRRSKRKEAEISMDQIRRLSRFDTLAKFDPLFRHCLMAVDAFCHGAERRSNYPRAQGALAVLIILNTCADRRVVADLAFDGPERAVGETARPSLAHAGDANFEAKLSPSMRLLIDRFYLAVGAVLRRRPARLFEVLAGAPQDGSSIGHLAKRLTAEFGCPLNAYDLKVLALKLMLLRNPKLNVAALSGLFGYKTTQAFQTRFRPLLAATASVRLADTLDLPQSAPLARPLTLPQPDRRMPPRPEDEPPTRSPSSDR